MLLSDFNLAVNCSSSAELYNNLHDHLYDPVPQLQGLLNLGLDTSYELLKANLHNESWAHELQSDIGRLCKEEVCSSLRSPGNADIAGIGAIIAYGLIVLLVLILCVEFMYNCRKFGTPEIGAPNIRCRKIFQNFAISIVYVQISTQLAFWIYLRWMRTRYELFLSLLTVRLMSGASVLTIVMAYENLSPKSAVQRRAFNASIMGSSAVLFFGFFGDRFANRRHFLDNPCYTLYTKPVLAATVSGAFYLLITSVLVSAMWGRFISRKRTYYRFKVVNRHVQHSLHSPERPSVTKNKSFREGGVPRHAWDLAQILVLIEALLLVVSFVLIVSIRQIGKELFGGNYTDDGIGYGQIMAIGFCLQTIVELIAEIWSKYFRSSSASSEEAHRKTSDVPKIRTPVENIGENAPVPLTITRLRTNDMEAGLTNSAPSCSIDLQTPVYREAATLVDFGPESPAQHQQ